MKMKLGPALIIGGALLGITTSLVTGCNGFNSLFGRYEVRGTVTAAPQSKTTGGENGLSTKFSIRLKTPEGERIINCSSTQCASLSPQDSVTLSCFEEWHLSSPNEEECRFVQLNP